MEASKIKDILEQHKLWFEGKGGKRADLTDANLRDANLTGADLQDSNLRGAYLLGAILRGANLRGAYLMGANLKDADLGDANLTGANLQDSNLRGAYLTGANLSGANLSGADLYCAYLNNAIGLPDISWIIPGCLVQLNTMMYNLFLEKEDKYDNFIQDSIGMFIQNNLEEETFDLLVEDKVIRGIPDWVKYTGLKQIESV